MNQFTVGDVVQLRCGCDKMTIVEIRDSSATCAWHAQGVEHRASYPSAALQAVAVETSPVRG
jgi:uncharacterized protein YodC (DUF2158 family)